MQPTRRQVVAAVGAVAVAGALGAGATAWRWYDRPPGEGLRALSAEEHAFVQAFAEAWMPAGGSPALSGADARLGDFFDDLLAALDPGPRTELKVLLHILDDLTLPTRLAPFRHLGLEARIEVLGRMLHSDLTLLRTGTQAVLVLVGTGWTTHPEVAERIRPSFRCGYGR